MASADWTTHFPALDRLPSDVRNLLVAQTKVLQIESGPAFLVPANHPRAFSSLSTERSESRKCLRVAVRSCSIASIPEIAVR